MHSLNSLHFRSPVFFFLKTEMQSLFIIFIFYFAYVNALKTMLQLTDIHYDINYQQNSWSSCLFGDTGLGCCRNNSIGIEPYTKASKWGDYNCDLSFLFINSTFQWIQNNINADFDLIMVNGDIVDHHDLSQSMAQNMNEIYIVYDLLTTSFPTSLIIPVIGNHDTFPIDQLESPFSQTWQSLFLSEIWQDTPIQYDLSTFQKGGYYKIYITKTKKIIILNSLYYDRNNLLIINQNDPSQQFQWFQKELQKELEENMTTWIVGHIPINSAETNSLFFNFLFNMSVQYARNIQYQFYGHTHQDYFYLFFNNYNVPIGLTFVSPSLLGDYRFPSFRIYLMDDDYNILNYYQYVCNLTETILTNQINYYIDYSALETYNLIDISPKSYYQLYENLKNNDTLLQEYHQHYIPGFNQYYCNETCKQNYLDEIVLNKFL